MEQKPGKLAALTVDGVETEPVPGGTYSDGFSGLLVNGGRHSVDNARFAFLTDSDGHLDTGWVSSSGKMSWRTDTISDFPASARR